VGTSILVVPLRNPLLLAKQLATMDFLTGGRVILGAGAGWMKEEFDLIGQSYTNRGKRLLEMVQLMRRCWSGEVVDFRGEFYQVSGFQMYPPPVKRDIPVIWGGHSDAAIRRCARTGDGWHPTQITIEQLRDGIAKLREYCKEYDRDPTRVPIVARPGNTYVVDDDAHAHHLELGVTHLVADTPIKQEDPDLKILRGEMERIARVCGLQARR
jgi:probable F420-dependent oxidoreductase